mgnify:CR=1 FL=1
MRLIEEIVSEENLRAAIAAVKSNKGAPGVDKMPTDALDDWFGENWGELRSLILSGEYVPQPVRRVYIPKANGKKRPLGIPTVVDRVVQQMLAQKLVSIYEPLFSEYSHGFRPGRSCTTAMEWVLLYVNEGKDWVIDLDIEKFFDTVNHDKLISILRERVNDAGTLRLVRSFLRAGVMEDGLVRTPEEGTPQGGPVSPVLSNIYLDRLDKELESRGLSFVRYADDCNIFVSSEKAAVRVMESVSRWLEKELRLKVSPAKTKVVRPNKSEFLGFGFWKSGGVWRCKPAESRKQRLKDKVKELTLRKKAAALPLDVTFNKLNWLIRGWINYFKIGDMKTFMAEFGEWLRHKVRVVIVKQWKRPPTIYKNLQTLNRKFKCRFTDEEIYASANSRLGLYRKTGLRTYNFLLSPKVLAMPNKTRPGLVNPLEYYISAREKFLFTL